MTTLVRACAIAVLLSVLGAGTVRLAAQQKPPKPPPPKASAHTLLNASELKWGPGPDSLPPGAQAVALEGDPSKPGVPFTIRVKFPDGYKIPPHWHPTDEHVVVLSGTLLMGLGDKWNEASMHALTAGGYAKMPKKTNHSAMAKGETVIQVYGTGPFAITYVDPKDDPRKKTTKP
jgi:quercetin dioxygenase-like cupin family protein